MSFLLRLLATWLLLATVLFFTVIAAYGIIFAYLMRMFPWQ